MIVAVNGFRLVKMKSPFALIVLLLSAALLPEATAQGPSDPAIWELTFEDEFDWEKLDYAKLTPKDPWGVVRNDELQAYILKAFVLENGILKIRCED